MCQLLSDNLRLVWVKAEVCVSMEDVGDAFQYLCAILFGILYIR